MDYRNIFGIAAVIFATGYLIRSFQPANAFPQGPNVSMGSNPIESFTVNCSWTSIFNNTSNQTFIITDIVVRSSGITAYLRENNNNGAKIFESRGEGVYSLNTGIPINPGTNVACDHSGYPMTISGYYTH
jgi:hypothetical protein